MDAKDLVSGQNWIGQYFDARFRQHDSLDFPSLPDGADFDAILSRAFIFAFDGPRADIWYDRRDWLLTLLSIYSLHR